MNKQKKTYQCTSCNQTFPSTRGKCICGEWNTIIEVEVAKKVYRLPKMSEKRKAQQSIPSVEKISLDTFFEYQSTKAMTVGNSKCQNCGVSIMNDLCSNEIWVQRRVLAHIIPKSKFISVSDHIFNCLFMCWQCHSYYDSSWSKAVNMPIFKLAIERYNQFKDLVTESKSHLPIEMQ